MYCHLFNEHCGFTVINIVLTLLKMKPMSQENQDSYISNCNTRRLYEINISKAFTLNRRGLLHRHNMRCRWETLSFGDFIKWFVSRLPFSTLSCFSASCLFPLCSFIMYVFQSLHIHLIIWSSSKQKNPQILCVNYNFIYFVDGRWCWP